MRRVPRCWKRYPCFTGYLVSRAVNSFLIIPTPHPFNASASHCLQENALEVLGFRNGQENRVIGGLGVCPEHAHLSSGQFCCLRQEIAKHLPSHMVRTGTSNKVPALSKKLHCPSIYGQVP